MKSPSLLQRIRALLKSRILLQRIRDLCTTSEPNKARIINHIRHNFPEVNERMEFYEVKALLREVLSKLGGDPILEDYIAQMERNANTIVMVVRASEIKALDQSDSIAIASTPLWQRRVSFHYPLCGGTAYGQQRSAHSIGSGFFLEKDMIATAAHVVLRSGLSLEDVRFVHGIQMTGPADFANEIRVHKSQVFKPDTKYLTDKKLSPAQHYLSEMGSDLAVMKVEPAYEFPASSKVETVRFPGDIHAYNNLFKSQQIKSKALYGMGHGLGLPLKVSYDGEVIHAPKSFPYFETDLLLIGGNSGSPVFDAETHELLGMYIRGTKKLELKDSGHCLDLKTEERISGKKAVEGQECQRLEAIWAAAEWLRQQK